MESIDYLNNYVFLENEFDIGDMHIIVIKTSHDAPDSRGYIIISGDDSIVYITDTGYINKKYFDILSNRTSVNSDGILIIDDTENFNVDDTGILNIKGIKSDEDITTPDKPEVEDPIKGEVEDNILNITSTAKLFIEDGVLIINDSNVVEDGVIKL